MNEQPLATTPILISIDRLFFCFLAVHGRPILATNEAYGKDAERSQAVQLNPMLGCNNMGNEPESSRSFPALTNKTSRKE